MVLELPWISSSFSLVQTTFTSFWAYHLSSFSSGQQKQMNIVKQATNQNSHPKPITRPVAQTNRPTWATRVHRNLIQHTQSTSQAQSSNHTRSVKHTHTHRFAHLQQTKHTGQNSRLHHQQTELVKSEENQTANQWNHPETRELIARLSQTIEIQSRKKTIASRKGSEQLIALSGYSAGSHPEAPPRFLSKYYSSAKTTKAYGARSLSLSFFL